MKIIKITISILAIFILNGCDKEKEIMRRPADIEYYCSNVTHKLVNDQCEYNFISAAYVVQECPTGYSLSGYQCTKGIYNFPACGAFKTYYGGLCYSPIPSTSVYKCSIGTLEGIICVQKFYTPASYRYICNPFEKLEGTYCVSYS